MWTPPLKFFLIFIFTTKISAGIYTMFCNIKNNFFTSVPKATQVLL